MNFLKIRLVSLYLLLVLLLGFQIANAQNNFSPIINIAYSFNHDDGDLSFTYSTSWGAVTNIVGTKNISVPNMNDTLESYIEDSLEAGLALNKLFKAYHLQLPGQYTQVLRLELFICSDLFGSFSCTPSGVFWNFIVKPSGGFYEN